MFKSQIQQQINDLKEHVIDEESLIKENLHTKNRFHRNVERVEEF